VLTSGGGRNISRETRLELHFDMNGQPTGIIEVYQGEARHFTVELEANRGFRSCGTSCLRAKSGIAINTSPTMFGPITQMQMAHFNGES
jgi:hypothetical protein